MTKLFLRTLGGIITRTLIRFKPVAMVFRFHKTYFIPAALLFFIEVLIAMFFHDNFVRPYVGDYLVVILIYCFVQSFVNGPIWITALSVLTFSYVVETLQYVNLLGLVGLVGLQHSRLANIIMGNSFSWIDMLTYTLGILTVLGIEHFFNKKKPFKADQSPNC